MLLKNIISFLFFLIFSSNIISVERVPDAFNYSKVTEKLGSKVYDKVKLKNYLGEDVELGQFFNEKPVVINMAYYTCPKLCHLITDALTQVISLYPKDKLNNLQILTISFDHRESSLTAESFRDKYLSKLDSSLRDSVNWQFLYGDSVEIKKLTDSIGYNYYFNAKSEQFSHPSVLVFLSPNGMISRYLYGIVFDLFDFKLSIAESNRNNTLSTVESMLLFCYNYDPDEKGYVLEAIRLMKVTGLLTVFFLIIFIYKLSRTN